MGSLLSLAGQQFARLTVVKRVGTHKGGWANWLCSCTCGNTSVVPTHSLRTGNTKSCGCGEEENRKRGAGYIDGRTKWPESDVYSQAKARCTNTNHPGWPDYGGRGIQFKFTSLEEFLAEIGFRPTPKHSLDRIDNNGHYEKGNVRWATAEVQQNNRRKRRFAKKPTTI